MHMTARSVPACDTPYLALREEELFLVRSYRVGQECLANL